MPPLRVLTAAMAAVLASAAVDPGLVDDPIAAGPASHTSLDGKWTACASVRRQPGACAISVAATAPGGLITDLEAAGVVGGPLYELNFLNSSAWDAHVWTFSTTFVAPAARCRSTPYLPGVL